LRGERARQPALLPTCRDQLPTFNDRRRFWIRRTPQKARERAGYANGIIFRAFADGTIGLAPALSCSEVDMDILLQRLRTSLDHVLDQAEVRQALA